MQRYGYKILERFSGSYYQSCYFISLISLNAWKKFALKKCMWRDFILSFLRKIYSSSRKIKKWWNVNYARSWTVGTCDFVEEERLKISRSFHEIIRWEETYKKSKRAWSNHG